MMCSRVKISYGVEDAAATIDYIIYVVTHAITNTNTRD